MSSYYKFSIVFVTFVVQTVILRHMNHIPSVNLKDFISNDPIKKQQFVDQIGKAYEEIGFVALKGHFLDDQLVDNLYNEIKNKNIEVQNN